MVRTAMGASPLSMIDWIARSMVCALVRKVRSVATDRLFLLLDIERKRTIATVNNKNRTMNSVILMRIETFFMGNSPINLCPTLVSALSEKYPMRTAFVFNSGDLGHVNRMKPAAGFDGSRLPNPEQLVHLSEQSDAGVLMFLKILIFSQFRFFCVL